MALVYFGDPLVFVCSLLAAFVVFRPCWRNVAEFWQRLQVLLHGQTILI